jgi:hypothetical protein
MYMQNDSIMSQLSQLYASANGLGLKLMNGVSGMSGVSGMNGMSGMNGINGVWGMNSARGMNMNGFSPNINSQPTSTPISVQTLLPKKHSCVLNTQCQSCAISICGTCSVVAGCGCGPFCNSCFQYTETCSGCGHTQCEHCVLNSLNGSCECMPNPDLISKLEDLGGGSVAGYNFFADWET